MKFLNLAVIGFVTLSLLGCAATPTHRAFKEGWRDSAVTSRVKWRMGKDKLVKAHNINVDTWRGVVTLNGRATSEEEKARAEAIATGVKNVKQVRNYLDVAGPADVPQKVVRENVPLSKPAGKYARPGEIVVPTIDKNAPAVTAVEPAKAAETGITEKNISEDRTEEKAMAIAPDDDVTSQAQQELKDLKSKRGK